MKKQLPFDKYDLYFRSVQDIRPTLDFIERIYRTRAGRAPLAFGEDFCGTFAMSCGWIRRGPSRTAVSVDLDSKPIRYGIKNYLMALSPDERRRSRVIQADVRSRQLPKVDAIASTNFSYFVFKERPELLDYFRNCRRRLTDRGLLILDCFGGSGTLEPNEEKTRYRDFTYFWDQVSFNPITHSALFYIHYQRRGERKRERVFRYDWRMWTLPELRDLLREAGFARSHVYWEGTNSRGHGNGIFTRREHEENCSAWIAYVVGER